VLERDLPQYGVRADPLFMRRLLTMLAHQHGGLLNASALGGSLGVSHHTLLRHIDVLESIYLLRQLPPHFRNVGKRLTKTPKVNLRGTGLLHHLLNISTADELASHPSRGASWEGFVIEDVLRREGCCTRARKPSRGCGDRPRARSGQRADCGGNQSRSRRQRARCARPARGDAGCGRSARLDR
jgi:predicted AAA+ superfamily ATPase